MAIFADDEFDIKERRPRENWTEDEITKLSCIFDAACNREVEKTLFIDGRQHEILETRLEYLREDPRYGKGTIVHFMVYLKDGSGETHTLLFEEKRK